MNVEIVDHPLTFDLHGFFGIAENRNYIQTAFSLMDKIWPTIKTKKLKHKGLNIWVYESDERIFAGVELEDPEMIDTGLMRKKVTLEKYAYYKHIGPYQTIPQSVEEMGKQILAIGLNPFLPHVEIYGHWNEDETKLETELLMSVK